jgi:hypothetical protein
MLGIIFWRMKRPSQEAMHLALGGDCVMNVASERIVDNVAVLSVTKASSSLTCRTGDIS